MNWIEVEDDVNKTKKFEVEVEIYKFVMIVNVCCYIKIKLTTGCIPNSNNNGPIISPPPIPTKPANIPLIKANIG